MAQTIKIMFFSWDNFYSKQIQKVTKCKWSHVGIAIENKDSYTVYEAIARGLVKSEYTKEFINQCIKDGRVLIKQTKKKYEESNIKISCDKYLGSSYDFLSIFNILMYKITKKAIKIDSVKTLFCSEFVARAVYDISNKQINFELEFIQKYDLITPADLFSSKLLVVYK